ncbi:putative adenosine/adenine deaminase [Longispora fulva]|uniref:Adenosine deaminase n=1 Tax=Longispora fulva TaxID=619741 RepID=A0A8J7GN50_9ACTN|nr:adenosine deaminase [Longispora fulva]MBG6141476.1 adenosine deaminase [Longispora fulva]GIG59375.1 putative adenosine/adenine deaminase [Longispora fulva]
MRDLYALPKAHLHLHLTGSMRPDTLAEWAARDGLRLPAPMPADQVHGWADFQDRYDTARAVVRSAPDIARLVREAAETDAADGAGWLELQVDPTSYAARLGSAEAVLEAVLAGVSEAPIPVGVVIAASWGADPGHAERLARLAAATPGVVGFGLSNDERLGKVGDFAAACRIAADAGLRIVPHAGFYEPAAHVRDCVEVLGAHRVGHAVTAATCADTLAVLAERRVAVELCPTSYPPLGVAWDLFALLDAGVPVALGTDDPLLFEVGLAGEYQIARDLGCDDVTLAQLARDSIVHSAAPGEVRQVLLEGVDAWLSEG